MDLLIGIPSSLDFIVPKITYRYYVLPVTKGKQNLKDRRVLNEKPKKLLVRFRYANGHYEIKEFDSDKDIGWYAYNEGDHLMDYEVINQ